MYRYQNSNCYAPSAQKLFVDIKDIIEQTFPTLHEDIINDALDYGRNAYEEYLSTGVSEASDLEAKEFFLRSVTERILEHNRREYKTLIELILVRERHPRTPLRSDIAQDLTSGFISLPSRPTEMIADKIAEISEENRKKFTPQRLKFPPVDHYEKWYPRKITIPKVLIDTYRMDLFLSLSDKLQKQVIRIENILRDSLNYRNKNVRDNVFFQIFDEMYNLSISIYNSNELERLLIDSVSHIIRNSSLDSSQKLDFMRFFGETINNQDNYTYYRTVAKDILR